MCTSVFASPTPLATIGLIAGTLVEAQCGWIAVEDLRIGDTVQSFDGGLARIVGLDRQWIAPGGGAYLLQMPGGAMDNCSDLLLLPGQNILIDTLDDAEFPEDLMVLIPALALDRMLGTQRTPIDKPLERIVPRFAQDEAIFANSGTLLHCPSISHSAGQPASDFFRALDVWEAQVLLQRLYGSHEPATVRLAA